MSCTKPNCDCWDIAVKNNGGEYPKYGYPCLHEDNSYLLESKKVEDSFNAEKLYDAIFVEPERKIAKMRASIPPKLNVPNK